MKRTDGGLIATSFRTIGDVAVIRPRSLDDALAALMQHHEPPAILAGGTDMVARFNEGFNPRRVLALADVGELAGIENDGEVLRIGALVTHAQGSQSDIVRRAVPGFAAAWARIANVRVRFTATIGGNVMARRIRYEMPVLLTALDAQIRVHDGNRSWLWNAQPYLQRESAPRELLTHVEIPLPGLCAFDYERGMRPIMTQALAVRRSGEQLHVRLALGTEAMAPCLLEATCNDIADDPEALAARMFEELPYDVCDHLTSNAYLRDVGRTLLARQLTRLAHGGL
jgi:aerobic carbon-monoxide dehydrogenase medium subunit